MLNHRLSSHIPASSALRFFSRKADSQSIKSQFTTQITNLSVPIATMVIAIRSRISTRTCEFTRMSISTQKSAKSATKNSNREFSINFSRFLRKFLISSEKQFYHHLLLHRQKLLECDFCGMRFNMKQPLQKHILHIHLDIRTQRETKPKSLCEICSKWVSSSRRHLATHFHELRPANFKCDFEGCEKSFTEMRNLQDHHNTHTSLSPYVCDFCNSTFRHRAALRSHRIRHTDPEKYKCDICCECFVTNQSLKKHISRQHRDSEVDVRPFKCDIENCTSTFKYEDFLVRHKKEVHSREF